MRGRFVGFRNIEQLKQYFPIDQAQCQVTANYNVAPTQEILVLLRRNGINTLEKYHWGLVPHGAKDSAIGAKMINARMETVKKVHHRMPAILHAQDYTAWLDSANQDTTGLLAMRSERTITDLVFRPVSRQVNSPRTNDPGNIQPVQLELEF
ncbi:MAG: SOS response-associated peptidase family protein [Desulfatitalea sp.]|nr:SOS response-associated peptidase family protein [Desulfatitalea sp.]